jgi:hypothetical protein
MRLLSRLFRRNRPTLHYTYTYLEVKAYPIVRESDVQFVDEPTFRAYPSIG